MSKSLVLLEKLPEEIVLVRLNRSEKLNALNKELLTELEQIVISLAKQESIRAVIFTGAGDKSFCAGADLKERVNMSLEETKEFVKLIGETFSLVANLPMPTIAAMNGIAFGGGLELALACDMRILAKNALVGLTECALGIIPGAGGTQRLPDIVGLAKAKELILTAKRVSSDEAKQIGIVNEVADNAVTVLSAAKEMALQIARCAPLSVRAAKKAIEANSLFSQKTGLAFELDCYESILHSKDRLEGLAAFAEKRKPAYEGY